MFIRQIKKNFVFFMIFITWITWLLFMYIGNYWYLFEENWFMPVTMMFGSFIAGATSEGGGAVAFPVMTLIFKIHPHIARDFSLMIQSIGMMAATFTIFFHRISVDYKAIIFSGLGGIVGIIIGIDLISPSLPPAYAKTFFCSTWVSFILVLFWTNKDKNRKVFPCIQNFQYHHAILLFFVGIAGGTVSGITGSGLDIVTFSVLVLYFLVDEKVATPTSVVLMGMNALVGFIWKHNFSIGMSAVAWNYWYLCIPIVVVGAPLGAWFIKNRSRNLIVWFLYISIIIQYIAALLIIPQNFSLILFNLVTIMFGIIFFGFMVYWRLNYRIPKEAML